MTLTLNLEAIFFLGLVGIILAAFGVVVLLFMRRPRTALVWFLGVILAMGVAVIVSTLLSGLM